jgi:SAM-dependent MidA family methyltransferase
MTALPLPLAHLPQPDAVALERSRALCALALREAGQAGFLPFARFMDIALYTPGLGYYAGGAAKLGAAGDFVTAPEMTPLFGRVLAAQLAELIDRCCDEVIELGAGSGALAAAVLPELERLNRLPRSYAILEVSAELGDRQRTRLRAALPQLCERVHWLDRLPERIRGVVLANEVLDALPVALVATRDGALLELGVGPAADGNGLAWTARPAGGELAAAARALALPPDYTTEVHLAARGLVRTLAGALEHGALLLLDYGFARGEYYHPQRTQGTLMCHYRHHAHADPLTLVGLQDITAHLDFTALAEAAREGGAELLGYTSQAQFLLNCGMLDLLAAVGPQDVTRYARASAAVQRLLSPAEMGELVKVIAFGRGLPGALRGFARGDRSHALLPRAGEAA